MGMRRLTLFAVVHAAGTALPLFTIPHLAEEALAGETGAALLLLVGTAAVVAGARTAVSVLLAHAWRLCAAAGLSAGPLRTAVLHLAPRAARTALTAAVSGSLTVAVLAGPTFAASPSAAWPLTPDPAGDDVHMNESTSPTAVDTERRDPAWPLSEEAPGIPPAHDRDPASETDRTPVPDPADAPEPRAGQGPDSDSAIHLVESGDSLWRIAASELPGAEASEVAARVEEVHSANRALVGTDANLILPGQRLVLP